MKEARGCGGPTHRRTRLQPGWLARRGRCGLLIAERGVPCLCGVPSGESQDDRQVLPSTSVPSKQLQHRSTQWYRCASSKGFFLFPALLS